MTPNEPSYGTVVSYREGRRIHILVELPEGGGVESSRGFADNLVDPSEWHEVGDQDGLRMKLVICRPRGRRRLLRRDSVADRSPTVERQHVWPLNAI